MKFRSNDPRGTLEALCSIGPPGVCLRAEWTCQVVMPESMYKLEGDLMRPPGEVSWSVLEYDVPELVDRFFRQEKRG
jgi:hypothetical protein